MEQKSALAASLLAAEPVLYPKRKFTFIFSHETMGDEVLGDRLQVAFTEYHAAGQEHDRKFWEGRLESDFDWTDFAASNGVRIQAFYAITKFPDEVQADVQATHG